MIKDHFALTEQDHARLAASYITPELAREAGWYRADHWTGVTTVDAHPKLGENYAGLIIPYYHPVTGLVRERVLRRDEPTPEPRSDGTWREVKKYVGPRERTNMFYLPPGVTEAMRLDVALPVLFDEGEKKALALWRIALEFGTDGRPLFLPIGLRGVWGWRGRTGKEDNEDGQSEPVKGPLNDFDYFEWKGREVTLLFDSNIHSPNPKTHSGIRGARKGLADHLHFILQANAFIAEMTREHFEQGINGPDDLAGREGGQAVMDLLIAATPAHPQRERAQTRRTPEQRAAAVNALRERSGSAEARAADVLGSTAAKQLAALWAEADAPPAVRDLLFTLEASAGGCEQVEFFQGDFYPTLFKTKESDYEYNLAGVRTLKSYPRKKLRERFDELERWQTATGLTFAYYRPGGEDSHGDLIPCRVDLYSRQYVAEVKIMAEEDPAYSRGIKAATARAVGRFVAERAGNSEYFKPRPGKFINRNKQIADGLKRTKGNLEATLERMDRRGDSQYMQAEQVMEILPDWMIEQIAAKYLKMQEAGSHTMKEEYGVTTEPGLFGEIDDAPPAEPVETAAEPVAEMEPENPSDGSHRQNAATPADSTNDFAGFRKTCKPMGQNATERAAIWNRIAAPGARAPSPDGSPGAPHTDLKAAAPTTRSEAEERARRYARWLATPPGDLLDDDADLAAQFSGGD